MEINIYKMTLQDLEEIVDILETDFDNFWNYNILKQEISTEVIDYTNPKTPDLPNQGIGSGAGYLEASNGTFEKITETL